MVQPHGNYFIRDTRAYTNQERNTQAKGDTPHLSEGVPNKITLIRLSQGSLDRWRREKVIWKMVTEHSCNPFADLKSESSSKEGRGRQGSPGRLLGQGRGYKGAGALGNVFNEGLSLGTKGAKGGYNECDHSHASAGGGSPGGAKVVARTGNL